MKKKDKKMKSHIALLAIAGNILMAGGDIAPVEPVVVEEAVSDEWKYSGSLYLWGAGMSGESATGDDIDISFSDIIDNLDFAYMGNIAAQKGKWGFQADLIYLAVGNKPNVDLREGLTLSNVKVKAWIVTPTVTYRVMESDKLSLDLMAGARYLDMKADLTVSPYPEVSSSGAAWDGIIGLKGTVDLSEKWFMPFQFDVGTGDTDMTWQAFAGIGYQYENVDLIAGYRYLDWDFDDDDKGGGTFNDLTISGPIIGAKYRF